MGPEFGLWGAKMYMMVLSHCFKLTPLLVNFGLDLPVHVQCGSFIFIWWFWGLVLGFGRGGATTTRGEIISPNSQTQNPTPTNHPTYLVKFMLAPIMWSLGAPPRLTAVSQMGCCGTGAYAQQTWGSPLFS